MIETFNIKPSGYKNRIDKIITLISSDMDQTRAGIDMLQELVNEADAFATLALEY